MYSSGDFEHLFIRYKAEAMLQGESIQDFCLKRQFISLMVQGYSTSHCCGTGRRISGVGDGEASFGCCSIDGSRLVIPFGENHDRYLFDRWDV